MKLRHLELLLHRLVSFLSKLYVPNSAIGNRYLAFQDGPIPDVRFQNKNVSHLYLRVYCSEKAFFSTIFNFSTAEFWNA